MHSPEAASGRAGHAAAMADERDQDEVLRRKDRVTRSGIGLQQWGDEPMGEGTGTGGSGTAERAARIAKGQKESLEDEP